MHRVNDRLLHGFIRLPRHRSRLVLDLDSTVVTVFGRQENAEVGYNPRYRGKRSYNPLLCIEANSSYLWDTELRPGNVGAWDGSGELMATCFVNVPHDILEIRVRADEGFGFNPVLEMPEARNAQYAVVARLTQAFKRLLSGLRYESVNQQWEMAELEYRPGTVHVSRVGDEHDSDPARHLAFFDGRAAMEPRIGELREDFALRKIPTASFAANALYLEIIRLAYNLVTAFQRTCLQQSWQNLTLGKLRYKLFLLPGELTRPQNRPVLRLKESSNLTSLVTEILNKIDRL